MKLAKIVGALMIPLAMGLTAPSTTQSYPPPLTQVQESKSLQERIDEILAPYNTNIEVSIKVVSLKDGTTVYEKNPDKKLIPASNLKLITSLIALKKLGPNYKFKTEFYTDGKIKEGIIEGNLYVKGYGDPYLVSEQLWLIVKDLHNKGIKEIKGDIIADDTYFDKERNSPGWYEASGEDLSRAYNAPNGALSLNFNTITVHVKAAEKIKEKPTAALDPDTKYARLINEAQTFKSYDTLTVLRENINSKDTITIHGGIAKGKEHVFLVNISKPDEYFLTVFKEFLEKEGIKVNGTLKSDITPKEAELILTHESKPLSLIIRDLCKYSTNFVADQLVKTLDAELNLKQGTNQGGVEIIKDYLDSLGLEDYEIVDGSGLSIKNKLTAELLTKILEKAYNDFEVFPEFITAQPLAGQDSTLQDRMYLLEKKVRAKTGLMINTRVSTISGYIQKGDEALAFAILMNGEAYSKTVSTEDMKHLQDLIIEEIIKQN